MPSRLIIGCGYLGSRVANAWLAAGDPVTAMTRTRADDFRQQGKTVLLGDILDPRMAYPACDTVLYAVGMDRSTGRTFREVYLNGLRTVLQRLPRDNRFIYISSTSVYGQSDGDWVDEQSPTEPAEENGKIIREAEQLLHRERPDAIILRFAGIYGPGRILRRAALMQGDALLGDAQKWLNLIHVQDGAAAVLAAAARGTPGEFYLVSDGNPVRRQEFYTYLAQLLKAPPARFSPLPADAPVPPHERGNRRIRNAKLLTGLGVLLQHGSYRVGLPASL